nr:reverse transcriptase domain-containing protein [Tanacetum cinerariifolium]
DDESLSDEDVPEDNVKIYSNPLFKFDDEYIFSDINPLFDEALEDIVNKDSYVSNLDELALLVTPLSKANEEECFDPGGNVDEINAFYIPSDFEDGYYDSEGDVLYLKSFLSDDTTPTLPHEEFLDRDLRNLSDINDLKIMVKVFDLEIHEKTILQHIYFLTLVAVRILTAVALFFFSSGNFLHWKWELSSLAVETSSGSGNSITGSGNALCILFPTCMMAIFHDMIEETMKGIDFMGPFPSSQENKYILVVVDYLSKWVEAKALPTNDARVVVKFLKSLFARFGTPHAIIIDRGTHFFNDQFAKVMLKYGVTHCFSTAYHLQTSEQVEVSNRGLKCILERTIGKNQASWCDVRRLASSFLVFRGLCFMFRIALDYEDYRACGFVHRSLRLQSLACIYMRI